MDLVALILRSLLPQNFLFLFKKAPCMKDFSYITNSSPAYIESLYQDFIKDPESVDVEYRKFFEGFDFAVSSPHNGSPTAAKPTAISITGGP